MAEQVLKAVNSTSAMSINDAQHQLIAQFMKLEAGIDLPLHKRKLLETRLGKRVKASGHSGIREYLDHVFSVHGNSERSTMIDCLTTNKTEFFREDAHFTFLQEWIAQQPSLRSRSLKAWSAACSTGQEPYTLSMVLAQMRQQFSQFDYSIFASDINNEVLQTARRATYNKSAIQGIPETYRRAYLLKSRSVENQQFRICADLRQKIQFSPFNLMQSKYPPAKTFDVIFCRNVLIYFTPEDRAHVIRKLGECLKVGGVLILGLSESIGENRGNFIVAGPTIYKKVRHG